MRTAKAPAPAHLRPRRARARWLAALLVVVLLAGALFLVFRVTLTVPPAQALAAGRELLAKKTVLAVVAHPDDLEWYIGGTLKKLADAGANVQVIVATDGEKGPNRIGAADLPRTRREEQLAAARLLGYSQVHFLGLPDRGAATDPRLLPRVQEFYRVVRPEAVFAFDPAYPSLPYLHPDHQGSARVFLSFWKTLGPERPPVYLFQTRRPDVAVDIGDVLNEKAQALAQHRSQNGGDGGRMTGFFRAEGRLVGVGAAETFRVLR